MMNNTAVRDSDSIPPAAMAIGFLMLFGFLALLLVGCGDITSAMDVPDAGGADGTGGHVLAQLDAGGGVGGAHAGAGGGVVPGIGGAVAGTGGTVSGIGGRGVGGSGGVIMGVGGSAAGAGGMVEVCLPNQACAQIPYCPVTGPTHSTPCPSDSLCGTRGAICGDGYDLSVLPCMGAKVCVSSCESCHS